MKAHRIVFALALGSLATTGCFVDSDEDDDDCVVSCDDAHNECTLECDDDTCVADCDTVRDDCKTECE
ncbi:MAG TPA: hypothetical protein VGK73_17150 [Polyangiaceae bacterium]